MKEAVDFYGDQALKQYNLDFDPRAAIVGDDYDAVSYTHLDVYKRQK